MVVALLAGGSQSANLNDPKALDANMAKGDNEADPAVTPIIEASADAGDATQASQAPRSASATTHLLMMYRTERRYRVWKMQTHC